MLKFSLPSHVQEAFTFGDCWALACEVEYNAGLPVAVLLHSGSATDDYNWFHVGNRAADGRIVDIEGIWDEDEWKTRWSGESYSGEPVVREWDREYLLEQVEVDEEDGEPLLNYPDIDSAFWAKQVLKRLT
jgi:hypothetical protein